MYVIYNPTHVRHDPPYEIYDGVRAPYAETAARAEAIIARLRQDSSYRITRPRHFPLAWRRRIHHPRYIRFLRERSGQLGEAEALNPSYFITDTYAPIVQHTYRVAGQAVDVALTAADKLLQGENPVYALCRPPGHHAEHLSMGGYCYFNNAAIAAEYLSKHGRVAVLDIDFHHGNGTQHSFYERSDVLYVSLHADPQVRYPYISGFEEEKGRGQGHGFTRNYPLRLGTTDAEYLGTLRNALRCIASFVPDYLIVSAGFDTYAHDPIGGFALTVPCYQAIGQAIAGLNIPTVAIQEGGYCVPALGDIAYAFLQGLQGKNL